jgi:hypothetical protein
MKKMALIAFLLSNPAVAGPATGNDIYAACTANPGGVEQGFCIGYIIGVFEGIRLGGFTMLVASGANGTTQELDDTTSSLQMLCMPLEAENGQIIAVAQQYLTNNPQSRHQPARSLIFSALRDAFPCEE